VVPARSKATLDVVDPATGAVLAGVPRGTAEDIDDAVRAAEAALPAWRDTSPATRGELLYRRAELVREHNDDINRLEAVEVGHPVGPSPSPPG
jgi:acyl-CoA reductase-like NAD-dependent aldehyde dehydrogenase